MRFIVFILILASTALACPSDTEFSSSLKKVIFEYLNNPEEASFTIDQVQDMITFYFSVDDVSASDCSIILGQRTGSKMSDFLVKSQSISTNFIPKCSDGTHFGECSKKAPMYCYGGRLILRCQGPDGEAGTQDDCSCGDLTQCHEDGSCSYPNIQCGGPKDCGDDQYVATPPICVDGNIHQEFIIWHCRNPGTAEAKCEYETSPRLKAKCNNGCEDGVCL